MTKGWATLTGFGAVLLWSLLALLTVQTAPVPPLQLNAVCFGLGGLIGLIWCVVAGVRVRRAGLDDAALRARLQKLVAVNMAALFLSVLGLMLVVLGIFLG